MHEINGWDNLRFLTNRALRQLIALAARVSERSRIERENQWRLWQQQSDVDRCKLLQRLS